MRRKGTSFLHFRKRIPLDILDEARGTTLALPVGDEIIHSTISAHAIEVTVSLRTREPNEAKSRHASLLVYLEGVWSSLRNGPTRLSHKQVLGLAGEAYKSLVGDFEDDPGESSLWASAVKTNTAMLAKGNEATEKWFGPTVDEILASHQLHIDNFSRKSVLDHVGYAITKASARLAGNASGDYGPDVFVVRDPAFDHPKEATPTLKSVGLKKQSITGLVDGWWREAKAAGRSISTYEAYERGARLLSNFLQHDDAHGVIDADIIRFKEYRLEQGISLKTITASDLSAIRQLFQWGIDNKKNHTQSCCRNKGREGQNEESSRSGFHKRRSQNHSLPRMEPQTIRKGSHPPI